MIPALKPLSRTLRSNPTEAEKKLWAQLSHKQFYGLKFRRQAPIENYIVDFLCFEKKMIIELDGGQHAQEPNLQKDKERDEILRSNGFIVLRFWNNDVLSNVESVLEEIKNTVHPHFNPPPVGGGNMTVNPFPLGEGDMKGGKE